MVDTSSSSAIEVLGDSGWSSQYRLEAGRRVLIGRDETNHLRINDDSCSRTHCEVFQSGDRWILRDAGSRNGTKVDGSRIRSDVPLTNGTVFELGQTRLRYVEIAPVDRPESDANMTSVDLEIRKFPERKSHVLREADSSVFKSADPVSVGDNETLRSMLGKLYQVATLISAASSIRALCETALEAALRHTAATFGGVLLLPSTRTADRKPELLELKAFRAKSDLTYARVSEAISSYIFDVGHAVHWQSISANDRGVGQADSVNEMEVRSAACLPLKFDDRIAGVMHLYSQDSDNPISDADFEFMLALAEQVAGTLRHLVESKKLGDQLKKAEAVAESLRDQHRNQTEIVGSSAAVQELRKKIERVAPTDATVLVRGESGVGKELVAQAMHYSSNRSGGPFVCMNCAALTESLLESELFGHEKGSFTGATGKKIGKFEQAHGGTLLLDEVGEMSMAIQSKFLRVLEGHPFERVGGSAQIKVDVRVVAATNRDLESAVREGTFRRDLYFRLQVMQIVIPSLRQRRSDIPLLAQHFIEKFRTKLGRKCRGLSPAAAAKLSSYHWPGNIRELQNTIERAVILADGESVTPDEIFLSSLDEDTPHDVPVYSTDADAELEEVSIEELEKRHILGMLDRFEWNKTQAAQVLGIERSTLDRKLKKYGVSRPDSE